MDDIAETEVVVDMRTTDEVEEADGAAGVVVAQADAVTIAENHVKAATSEAGSDKVRSLVVVVVAGRARRDRGAS